MEVVSEIREKESMFTYPVLTYSLLRRNDLTEDQLQEMIRTKKWDIFVDKDFDTSTETIDLCLTN